MGWASAKLDRFVDILHGSQAFLGNSIALDEESAEGVGDDEAFRVAADNGLLAAVFGYLDDGIHGVLGSIERLDHLDELHHRGGVEPVHPTTFSGRLVTLSHRRDAVLGGIRGQNGVGSGDFVQFLEDNLLEAEIPRLYALTPIRKPGRVTRSCMVAGSWQSTQLTGWETSLRASA